jgi:acetylornithine deacetylase/succinyl-diaminopimelate desuccinylase family protein
MNDHLLEAIASYQDEMVDFTRDLVAIPTENPPGAGYRPCIERIGHELDKVGLGYTVIEVPGPTPAGAPEPRYCLVGHHGRGTRTLYFHGHYDVVPASDPKQVRPYRKGGNLFGRGSSDMKGGLASMVYAVKALKDCAVELDGRVCLTVVPDEETGGQGGSQYLAAAGLLGRDGIGMLTAEPTGGVVWNASRGAISLRVTVRGKPAHVGLHYLGVNAFERMLAVAGALRDLKAEVEARGTEANIQPGAARRSILLLGGRCEGGTNFNVVPGACSFTIDRRINPEEDLGAEKERLLGVLEGVRRGGIDLEVQVLQEGESAAASPETPLGRVLAENIERVTGKPAAFAMCPGLLEIRFYARRGVPAFAYGPGLLSVAHGPCEFIKVKDIGRCAAVYALTAAQLLTA